MQTVRLVHPFPVAMVLVVSLAILAVAHGGMPPTSTTIRAMAVIALSQIAVGALNDYVDRRLDAVAQPSKPIPAGRVSPRTALILVLASLLLLVPIAASFGPVALALALFGAASGLAYDLWLKPTIFSFVAYIAGFLALVTWLWYVAGVLKPIFVLVYPAGSLLMVAAHLAQSLPDIETDRATGQFGLATTLGPILSIRLIIVLPGVVALGGLALSAVVHANGAFVLVLVSLLGLFIVLTQRKRAETDQATRVKLFRVMAPSIGVLGLGCLLALRAASQ